MGYDFQYLSGVFMSNNFMSKVKEFWLFSKSGKGLSMIKRVIYEVWNALVMLASAVLLGILSLLLAYGNYNKLIFNGYFENSLIALLNVLPVVLLFHKLHGKHLEQLIGKQYQKSLLGEIDHH